MSNARIIAMLVLCLCLVSNSYGRGAFLEKNQDGTFFEFGFAGADNASEMGFGVGYSSRKQWDISGTISRVKVGRIGVWGLTQMADYYLLRSDGVKKPWSISIGETFSILKAPSGGRGQNESILGLNGAIMLRIRLTDTKGFQPYFRMSHINPYHEGLDSFWATDVGVSFLFKVSDGVIAITPSFGKSEGLNVYSISLTKVVPKLK